MMMIQIYKDCVDDGADNGIGQHLHRILNDNACSQRLNKAECAKVMRKAKRKKAAQRLEELDKQRHVLFEEEFGVSHQDF